jgi:hypothetical protein
MVYRMTTATRIVWLQTPSTILAPDPCVSMAGAIARKTVSGIDPDRAGAIAHKRR